MIQLGNDAVPVPDVEAAADGAVTTGTIVVAVARADRSGFASDLPGGRRVVLTTRQGRLELTTSDTIADGIDAAGTYVSPADEQLLPETDGAQLQLYRRYKDWWRKVRSPAGRLPAIGGLVAFLAVIVGVIIQLAGASGPTSASTAADAQRILTRAMRPADELAAAATSPQVAAIQQRLLANEDSGRDCLAQLGGGSGTRRAFGDVTCKPPSPSWLRDRAHALWITSAFALVAGILALIGLLQRFGFGKSPEAAA